MRKYINDHLHRVIALPMFSAMTRNIKFVPESPTTVFFELDNMGFKIQLITALSIVRK